jgi:hypothetical protein
MRIQHLLDPCQQAIALLRHGQDWCHGDPQEKVFATQVRRHTTYCKSRPGSYTNTLQQNVCRHYPCRLVPAALSSRGSPDIDRLEVEQVGSAASLHDLSEWCTAVSRLGRISLVVEAAVNREPHPHLSHQRRGGLEAGLTSSGRQACSTASTDAVPGRAATTLTMATSSPSARRRKTAAAPSGAP